MKFYFKLTAIAILLMQISSFTLHAQLLENGGFEEINNCSLPLNGSYHTAFEDGCLGPRWSCYNSTPSVNIEPLAGEGPAFEGIHFAHIVGVIGGSVNEEAFFYNGLEVPDSPVDFSMAVRSNLGTMAYYVYATNVVVSTCDFLSTMNDPSAFPGQMIASGQVNDSEGWKEVLVEGIVFPETIFDEPTTNLVFYTDVVDVNQGILYIDNVGMRESSCEDLCNEVTDLTACEEEGDFGFIFLECDNGPMDFSWDFPSGSSALQVTTANSSVVFQAGEGIYSVTITDGLGCVEVRTYEILADCCVEECVITAPETVDCRFLDGQVIFSWSEVPGAVSYELRIEQDTGPCCDTPFGVSWLPIFTDQLSFILPPEHHNSCLSWRVRAICEDGTVSEFTDPLCYDNFTCFERRGLLEPNTEDLGIEMLDLAPRVYPNPGKDQVLFELSAPEDLTGIVRILNLEGVEVGRIAEQRYEGGLLRQEWQIPSSLPNGLYLVHFSTNHGNFTTKLIVER